MTEAQALERIQGLIDALDSDDPELIERIAHVVIQAGYPLNDWDEADFHPVNEED